MATATQDIMRRSYIDIVKSTGVAKFTFSTKKKRWMVLYKDSRSGLSRLEIYQSEEEAITPLTVIALSTVTSVEVLEGRKEFVVSFPGNQVTFACSARADVDDWVLDINTCRGVVAGGSHATNGTALYDAIPGDEVFTVRLRRSETLSFQGSCILEIEKNYEKNEFHISLFTEQSPRRLIVKWQIDHIRQYGSNESAFKFQSGSKSSTGVDWFVMDTEPGTAGRIHRAVDHWANHIVQQIKNRGSVGMASPRATVTEKRKPSGTTSLPSGSAGEYQPINTGTMAQPSVYDSVGIESQRLSMHENPANHSQGHYQPLQQVVSPAPTQETQYISLNPSTRESSLGGGASAPSIPPRTPAPGKNSTQSQYMELKQDTREQVEPSYMGIGGK